MTANDFIDVQPVYSMFLPELFSTILKALEAELQLNHTHIFMYITEAEPIATDDHVLGMTVIFKTSNENALTNLPADQDSLETGLSLYWNDTDMKNSWNVRRMSDGHIFAYLPTSLEVIDVFRRLSSQLKQRFCIPVTVVFTSEVTK